MVSKGWATEEKLFCPICHLPNSYFGGFDKLLSLMNSKYLYKLNGPATFSITFFMLIFAGLMIFMAILEPHRFIGLGVGSPFGAIGYAFLASGSLFLALRMIWTWMHQRNSRRSICLHSDTITLPKSVMSDREITISYSDIRKIDHHKIARTSLKIIQIHHSEGITQISNLGIASQADFSNLYDNLRLQVSKSL
jgi:hypothetical protein